MTNLVALTIKPGNCISDLEISKKVLQYSKLGKFRLFPNILLNTLPPMKNVLKNIVTSLTMMDQLFSNNLKQRWKALILV